MIDNKPIWVHFMQVETIHKNALSFINSQNYEKAHQACLQILQIDNQHADAYFLLGIIACATGSMSKAISLIEKALSFTSDNSEYIAHLAKCYAFKGEKKKVELLCERAIQLKPKQALTLDTIGTAFSRIGLYEKSVLYFQHAVQKQPDNPAFLYNLGAALRFMGDFDGARRYFEQAISLNHKFYKAHSALSGLRGITQESNHISRLQKLINNSLQTDELLHICHAIASEYEALHQYDSAFEYLEKAKFKKRQQLNYQFSDDVAIFDEIFNYFQSEHLSAESNCLTKDPIFVVGMPRTGTTLVERIISQHSQVASVGELQNFGILLKQLSKSSSRKVLDPETILAAKDINYSQLGNGYIESTRILTGNKEKFVDKMPLNILYAGFILQSMPNAKIICLDRHLLDTIISNFKQLFAVNFSYYNYAYALKTTAEFFVRFHQLRQFWQSRYPDNFLIVNYETLVNNPEVEAKKIISHCSLEWQSTCLNIESNNTPVATASAVQIREPIHNRSVGHWKNYEKHLAEVKLMLDHASINY